MKNNEYLEGYKIQAVKRIYAGESQKACKRKRNPIRFHRTYK